ncbi:hypothetical protein T440DRAFT_382593 [Plenodomus tracheiphilus IPT5]|uniref:Zn(2)-C6 fungal-type domain-containing protein n=1 Tax=Plenodomus tracheiphilus IPT5 TaxID=1408161 RepID=A0A6A7BQG0_9PLEO|nr:hypothetical protein T440DRAFT_382593 [Plenodomus tracheiphilus IPT5]
MPKQRQTCTRCSQRRQKCDRRTPCTRCVQNAEGHLCTTKWLDGYNPSVHRRYPRKTSPMTSWRSTASSETSSSGRQAVDQQALSAGPEPIDVVRTPSANPPAEASRWSTSLPDVTINSLLTSKDQPQVNPLLEYTFTYVKTKGGLKDLAGVSSTAACSYSPTARVAEIQHLHSLLPPKERVLAITDYYEQYMLYWVGALYHAPTFRKTLLEAYGTSQELSLTTLDWRFSALFFSILAAAMSGSPESSSMAWGFTIDDKVRLARAWGNACVSCLNLGNYTSRYHIWSVQAIYIMHAYEHLIGSTNQWLALRAVAVVIAKGLGLHKIATHPDDDRVHELNGVQMQAFKDREMGRRVWRTVALQEWYVTKLSFSWIIKHQSKLGIALNRIG